MTGDVTGSLAPSDASSNISAKPRGLASNGRFTVTHARMAESLLKTTDWSRLRSIDGNGEGVRHAIEKLLASNSSDEANRAYWGIENHAVAQGELFEVSEACTSVLVASLADPREPWVRIAALELLFQIVSGYASSSPGTPPDLLRRCQEAVREGLWLLFREVLAGASEAALEVLDRLGEGERARRLLNAAR